MKSELLLGSRLEPSAPLETATNSFVVIIRAQPPKSGEQRFEWHGSVEHAQSRECIFFIEYSRLTDFIAARCQTPRQQTWRTRLTRRWQRTALHHWLNPLKST
jgi:hypothetical protein